jgi:hypothetical protein
MIDSPIAAKSAAGIGASKSAGTKLAAMLEWVSANSSTFNYN